MLLLVNGGSCMHVGPNCRMIIEEILAMFDQVVKRDNFIIGWL